MNKLRKGDFVSFDGAPGVVVSVDDKKKVRWEYREYFIEFPFDTRNDGTAEGWYHRTELTKLIGGKKRAFFLRLKVHRPQFLNGESELDCMFDYPEIKL